MIKYTILGPTPSGAYLVIYPTPGCNVPTVAYQCRTEGQAGAEASRLNEVQAQREKAVQAHLDALDRYRIVDDMEHR